jgi:hypothetical protein
LNGGRPPCFILCFHFQIVAQLATRQITLVLIDYKA